MTTKHTSCNYRWAYSSAFPTPDTWMFKKDVPDDGVSTPLRVDFGLHGLAYVMFRGSGDTGEVRKGNNWMPVYRFHLKTAGRVIGPHDLTAGGNREWQGEWRAAMNDRIMERIGTV